MNGKYSGVRKWIVAGKETVREDTNRGVGNFQVLFILRITPCFFLYTIPWIVILLFVEKFWPDLPRNYNGREFGNFSKFAYEGNLICFTSLFQKRQ